ncbi:MAG: hypothetical protein GY754_28745 [bacterium]|nr:hypothetical protein [bacterium]
MLKKRRFLNVLLFVLCTAVLFSCSTFGVKKETLDDGRKVYTTDSKDGKLSEEAVIKGRVVTGYRDKEKPIANATVELKNANMGMGYYLAKTDSNGNFEIKGYITQVSYILEVIADGYVSYRSKGKISPGKQTIRLTPEAIISGVVSNSSGKGLSGVEVKLRKGYRYYRYNRSSQGKPVIVKTDENGRYKFRKLAYARYYVTFNRAGYITETASLKYINSGETFTLPMRMYRPASLSGKITIKGLKIPAVNINVTALGRWNFTGSTYHDGTYRVEDLKPGRYKLRITHQGFYKLERPYITIPEGQELKNLNFVVVPKKPEVNIYTYRYTFAPGNKVSFNLRTFRVEKVKATLYKVPVAVFLKGRADPDSMNPGRERFKKISSWDEPVRNFRPYDWRYQNLDIKKPLSTGGYCIEVKGPGRVLSRKFFTVTSVGVVVKRSRFAIMTYVTNLVNNKPIRGARVVVFDSTPSDRRYKNSRYPHKPPKRIEDLPVAIIKKGKTGKGGVFKHRVRTKKHLSVLVIGKDGSYALCSTGSPAVFQREKNKYYIYTDRPVYRAGDTVFYKIIGKTRKSKFVPRAGHKFYYKIRNRDMNKTIKEGSMTLDQWGTANGKIKLSTTGNLGVHEIRVGHSKKNLYGAGRFYVEQYRKPEFKIDLTPARDYFINGDTVDFKIESKYFFGAPLKGALVRFRFYETRLRDTDTRYWWEEDSPVTSYNRIMLEGEKYLDGNGIARASLYSGSKPYDREITLEATVVDKSNISVTTRKKIKVGRGEFYVKINPEQNFFADDEKKKVIIKTLSHTGKPVSAKLKVALYRYTWKPYQRVYVHGKRPIFERKIETGADGKAKLALPEKFLHRGEFDIVVTGADRRNNTITASRVIWIYNRFGGNIASRFKNLELDVNSKTMQKPGPLTCLIKTRFTNAHVLLTLEGKDIYLSKVVRLKGNITPITLPVKASYAPNFYVTATMQRKRALFTSTANISLPTKDTEMDIFVKPDRERYMPGDTATIQITAKNKRGAPVKADISLSAVDEAIYHVRRDFTPHIRNFFYTKISNWVLSAYSYPITVLAGAGKEGKVKVREKFEDTAFWKANIRTNAKGKASVSFTLPDNLTTWRLTVRGHDRAGRLGQKRKKFLVTQDLIARIGKPRFMIEKDTIGLIGIVNSNTGRGLPNVNTTLKVNGKIAPPDSPLKISLPAFGSARSYHTIVVPEKTNRVTLRYDARADAKAKDALRVKVPVEKRGSPFKLYGMGDLGANKKVVLKPLKSDEDFEFVPETITISVNPSPVLQILKATKDLIKYPYGCVEQTLNKFVPLLAVHQVLKDTKYSHLVTSKDQKDIGKMTAMGVAKMQRFQNSDGSWGWWSGDRGNYYLTGYVLYSLFHAKKYGYKVDKNTVKRGLSAVRRMITSSSLSDYDAKAYLLYVYALWGKWDMSAYNDLEKGFAKNGKNPYSLTYTVRALTHMKPRTVPGNLTLSHLREKRSSGIKKYLAELKGLMKKDAKGIYWQSFGRQRWGWQGGRTEMTAHVLSTLIAANDRSSMAAQAVSSLARRSVGTSWGSTKETAHVIFAICDFVRNGEEPPSGRASIQFSMEGKQIASFEYDPGNIKKTEELVKHIPVSGFSSRKDISVTASGTGGKTVFYNVAAAGTLYFKPKGFLSVFKSEKKGLSSLSNGIELFRNFSGIARVRDIHNREYMVPRSLQDKKTIRVGDELLVTLRFKAHDDFEYLVLEDYLPSGFEVVRKNAYDEYKPYVHSERWDNRMVFFFNKLRKGQIYEIAYIVRAELPGSFMVRASRMECMYEPSIQGWSAPSEIKVQKK